MVITSILLLCILRCLACPVEIQKGILVAARIELEDAPVQVKVLQIEDVLVVVAVGLEAFEVLRVDRLVKVDAERWQVGLLISW